MQKARCRCTYRPTIASACSRLLHLHRLLFCLQIGDLQLLPASSLGRLRAYEWQAAAASLSDPLSAQELLLISLRGHLPSAGLQDNIEEADTPKEASPFAFVITASTSFNAIHHAHWRMGAFLQQVTLCYQGKGSCAWTMGYPSTSCEGRLWQYSDGTLGFLWIHPVHGERIVDYARLDGDLELARH